MLGRKGYGPCCVRYAARTYLRHLHVAAWAVTCWLKTGTCRQSSVNSTHVFLDCCVPFASSCAAVERAYMSVRPSDCLKLLLCECFACTSRLFVSVRPRAFARYSDRALWICMGGISKAASGGTHAGLRLHDPTELKHGYWSSVHLAASNHDIQTNS